LVQDLFCLPSAEPFSCGASTVGPAHHAHGRKVVRNNFPRSGTWSGRGAYTKQNAQAVSIIGCRLANKQPGHS